ncbi:Arr3p NDAI_0H00130 [Naumovozyma dairenensis CBS 421]|uniref:Arsenical-resistance protein n=1 Tax=Naumovozyma dairenensis (strain ATCC 10597 / BCRC 20456 / CBS 421 / NBRC 0211 / NRRL Y-12639) TaxID=1071378 RepID=G0WEH6_NAUDC|nr:hypothetical protein NDAI_0H00130 [Naumovozyma dairenensis CBS 421]CCD26187.1 hypothetical protein NDAI_0H00130 [Naumovozyma dairenensis CBS 421]
MKRSTWLQIIKKLSWTDILLPFTIIISIIIGLVISEYCENARKPFTPSPHQNLVGVSIPLAVGMVIMMLPPLCNVEWEVLPSYIWSPYIGKQLIYSLVLNWIICPFIMFGLAWLVLFKEPEYREGIIMIGMARCIAMVITWNQISGGDMMLCVVIVIINSLLQMVLYAPYQIFFCYVITGTSYNHNVNVYSDVAKSVGVFLGIPLGAGFIIRFASFALVGKENFNKRVMPLIKPWGLIAFHYTIIVIFIGNGHSFLHHIGSAFLCFVPLTLYFIITWFGCFFLMRVLTRSKRENPSSATTNDNETDCNCEKQLLLDGKYYGKKTCSADFPITMTQCFTAASNNFELSLAVAVSLYGNSSKQAIAATFGPLLEVPILLILAIFSKYFEHAFIWRNSQVVIEETDKEKV